MQTSRRLRWFYFAPVAAWLALIFFLSTSAGGSGNTLLLLSRLIEWLEPGHIKHLHFGDWNPLNYAVRKLAHISEYAVLALLTFRALQFGTKHIKPFSFLGAWGFAVLYACTDEFHQAFVPGRTSSIRDVGFDALGAAFALLATRVWFLHRSLESRLHAKENLQAQSEAA